MTPLKHVGLIVVHCAASSPNRRVSIDEVRRWHVEGNGWDEIGYHYYIDKDGVVHPGRSTTFQGAHEPKINTCSLAICLEGDFRGTWTLPPPSFPHYARNLCHYGFFTRQR
ncbi:N-acetylmuramoyl-L-alanine amidase [Pseudobowmanella zhangzhouensis]|uniref:N-acetylmuramoyl-L-alanine amidase n=1 Tax=Pseudobowmanella zhangzhouensis TaxID=1537679 RepID=UPI0036189E58